MSFFSSTSRICVRALGVMLAVVFFAAAPIFPSQFAPAQAQAAGSIEFRTALEPYGRWQRHARWGEVWIPANRSRDWRPYTAGHWVHTEQWGWYWISDDSEANWGWVTYHYGRWVFDRDIGSVWVPGDEWSPAWVQWRRGAEYVGWAALPPEDIVAEYRDEPTVWVFVRGQDFVAPRIVSVILPVRQYSAFIGQTVIVNRTVVVRDRGPRFAVNPGISPAIIAAVSRRPLRAYEVRPVVFAGTAKIPGALEVRAQDLRGRNIGAQVTVRQTQNVIRPADRVQPPQPLAAGEQGRLGDNPPRAARGGTPQPATGQGRQQQEQQGRGAQQQPEQKQQQEQTQGRGADQPRQPQTQQGPRRDGEQQREGRGGPPPKQQPATEGRGGPPPKQQPAAEGRGGPPPKQQPATEGRGGPPPKQQPATEGRGGPPPKQQPAAEGRGGPQPKQQPATEGRGGPPPKQQPAAEGRGGPQPKQQPATEGRGGPPPKQQPATEGRGGPGRGGPGGGQSEKK